MLSIGALLPNLRALFLHNMQEEFGEHAVVPLGGLLPRLSQTLTCMHLSCCAVADLSTVSCLSNLSELGLVSLDWLDSSSTSATDSASVQTTSIAALPASLRALCLGRRIGELDWVSVVATAAAAAAASQLTRLDLYDVFSCADNDDGGVRLSNCLSALVSLQHVCKTTTTVGLPH